jgi:NAD(P)-dependent dehydrogenase (short-subunit alcohol dehydrogenase family)
MTHPTYDFSGKVVLVTGATGGMGRAITVAFASAGASVMASDLSTEAGADLLADVTAVAADGTVTLEAADISDADEVSRLVSTTVERYGRLDAAVNAAAIEFETVALAECAEEDFDRMMNVNTRGLFACMKYQIRAMLDSGAATSRAPAGRS